MTAGGKVLFYVQHLLGVGHVFRSMRIVAGLVAEGFDVEVIYGGQKLDNFRDEGAKVHFLPSLNSAKGDFSRLITAATLSSGTGGASQNARLPRSPFSSAEKQTNIKDRRGRAVRAAYGVEAGTQEACRQGYET